MEKQMAGAMVEEAEVMDVAIITIRPIDLKNEKTRIRRR